MARFAPLGFTVAPDTLALMRQMADGGELATLVPERVWQELAKALRSPPSAAFLYTLRQAWRVACAVLLEVDALYGVPQRVEYHPEIDTGLHQELVCDMAAPRLAPGDDLVGFAALCHDLGKALTPADALPRHLMHEQRGVVPVMALCERLKVPAEHRDLAVLCCREHLNVHRINELKDATLHDLLARCDGFRKLARIDRLAIVCEADARPCRPAGHGLSAGRNAAAPARRAALAVRGDAITAQGVSGPALEDLRRACIAAIATATMGTPCPEVAPLRVSGHRPVAAAGCAAA